jgi:hypothetical protein
MAKLFVNTTAASAVATARDSIEVGLNDAGVPVVRFALARGKGTGAQEVPVEDLPAFIEALNGYAVNGLNRTAKALSTVDMLHATIAMNDDDRIAFRIGTGKGAKPTNMAPEELPGVVAFLNEVSPVVIAAAKKIKK